MCALSHSLSASLSLFRRMCLCVLLCARVFMQLPAHTRAGAAAVKKSIDYENLKWSYSSSNNNNRTHQNRRNIRDKMQSHHLALPLLCVANHIAQYHIHTFTIGIHVSVKRFEHCTYTYYAFGHKKIIFFLPNILCFPYYIRVHPL